MTEIVEFPLQKNSIRQWPWARAYQTIRHQPGFLLYTMVRTREREHLFQWVGPIAEPRTCITVRSDAMDLAEGEPLDYTTYRVGSLRDTISEKTVLNTGVDAALLHRMSDVKTALNMLMVGRLDAVIYNETAIRHTLQQLGHEASEVRVVKSFETVGIYYALSRDVDEAFVRQLQSAFDTLRENGTVEAVTKSYQQ